MASSLKVPPLDLKRQYEPLLNEVRDAVGRVITSGNFILGPDVQEFEKEVAAFLGVKNVIGVTSGTDALWLGLKAVGIKPGDEVLTSPFTFFATVSATVNSGASPRFADIEPGSFNLDPMKVDKILSEDKNKKIKAIMPVHCYGQAADMSRMMDVAKRHGVFVIEDAAQAIGTKVNGQSAGGVGNLGAFSLFPTKNLGAIGDAGFVTTNDADLADRVQLLRTHGSRVKYHHDTVGSNCRIDTLQAAVLRVFLPHLPKWISERQAIAQFYDEKLQGLDGLVVPPARTAYGNHTFHQYTIRVPGGRRDDLKNRLTEKGISTAIYYPIPCHLQKALKSLGHRPGDFPLAEAASAEALSIPIFPGMTKEEQLTVVNAITDWVGDSRK